MRASLQAAGDGATAPADAPVLELRGITAGYGRVTVLRDVSLGLGRGEVAALLGPNGAGKTTLLSTVAGLLRPSAGQILSEGADLTRLPTHERTRAGISLIPEGRGIFRNLTVKENLGLELPPWLKGEGVDRALEAFPLLRERLGQTAGTMSGGQQQMLAVARAYLARPKVVLLDEVSMGLAPKIIDQIFDSLMQLVREGISILLVEQYVNRALELASSAHLLNRGELVFSGAAGELDEEMMLQGYLGVVGPEGGGSAGVEPDRSPTPTSQSAIQ
jgi:branched-chain amino acid transport system ATP-binding protein